MLNGMSNLAIKSAAAVDNLRHVLCWCSPKKCKQNYKSISHGLFQQNDCKSCFASHRSVLVLV